MTYTLEQFIADTNATLSADHGPEGRETVRRGLERLLANPEFIEYVAALDISKGVSVLHRDKEHGYLILAHTARSNNTNPPHNHGRSWAIYGQVTNYTDMTEWTREKGEEGQLKVLRSYRLLPGDAGTYQNGAIHSVTNTVGTRIIRVTGTDLDTIDRQRFDPENGNVQNLPKKSGRKFEERQ